MPLKVFYSYAHKDEALRDRLEKALANLRHQNLIESWHDRRILAGQDLEKEIDEHIKSADIILLLVSPDFMASDYCYGIEMRTALERDSQQQARVIPIILEAVDWSGAPFAHLKALPRDGKPVSGWGRRNEAFLDIANGIREVVNQYRAQRPVPEQSPSTAIGPGEPRASRVPRPAQPLRGSKRIRRSAWLPILLALISFAGVIIAAVIGKLPEFSCERPRPAIEAPFNVSDFFKPGGFMGDGEYGGEYLEINDGFTGNLRPGDSDGICTRIQYKQKGKYGWAGIYWTWPDHNLGNEPGRRVAGASKVSFWAAGEMGTEVVAFKAGGIHGKRFADSFEAVLGQQRLTKKWKHFEIDLRGKDLSDVIGAFAWDAAANWNNFPLTFYLDDIRYE